MFEHENLFVRLRYWQRPHWNRYSEHRELPKVALSLRARDASKISMELELNISPQIGGDATTGREEVHFVFIADDLPSVRAMLLRQMENYKREMLDPSLRISVDHGVGIPSKLSELPFTRLGQLLEPLREFRGMDLVDIDSPGSFLYRDNLIAAMCCRPQSVTEIMEQLALTFDCADEAVEKYDYESAISEYKNALCTIRGTPFHEDENDVVLTSGRFSGLAAGR